MCSLGVSHLLHPILPPPIKNSEWANNLSVTYYRIQHCIISRKVDRATTNLRRSESQNSDDFKYRPMMKQSIKLGVRHFMLSQRCNRWDVMGSRIVSGGKKFVVVVAPRVRAGWTGVPTLAGIIDFYLLWNVQTVSGAHPASYLRVIEVLLRQQSGKGVKLIKVKAKVTLEQASKAQRRSRGIALLFP